MYLKTKIVNTDVCGAFMEPENAFLSIFVEL
jgi:hypothetical protein